MNNKFQSNSSINHNIDLLYQFDLSDENSLKIFNKSTRDINNLNALKCEKSGVIVLEKCLTTEEYYKNNSHQTYESKVIVKTDKGEIETIAIKDDIRRFETYKELIKGSEILDFGCENGDFLLLSKEISKRSVGLEITKENKDYTTSIGIECVSKLAELNDDQFDLITLNHVLEHLNDPINILVELQKYLKDDGIIIIEVPHARDLMLETFNLDAFKNFTLWSEHLILHTRKSLETFASNSGLQLKKIEGCQRYPISNHYNWLLNSQPSGHEIFHQLNNEDFHKHYEKLLDSIDQTDTLIGYFDKKKI
jgi:2-polyprenyl-3-methyl-5-hydroxy-6-metoxy-1,4-benzoquinol methylase